MDEQPLFKQKLFTAALIIPLVSFLTFGAIAWIGHKPQLDAEGLNNFIEISKLPLAMLSLAVPLGVVVNNIHRTIQTSAQIREAQRKNKNDFFYSHQKNTLDHISNIKQHKLNFQENFNDKSTSEYITTIDKPLKLYRKIFTKMSYNELNMTQDIHFRYRLIKITGRINNKLKEIIDEYDSKAEKSHVNITKSYHQLERYLERLAACLCIDPFYRHYNYECTFENHTLVTMYKSESEIICVMFNYFHIAESLCEIIDFKHKIDFDYPYKFGEKYGVFDTIFRNAHFKELPNNDAEIGFSLSK
ncbi:hypothetical protein FZI57_20290 [Cronobacter sakazakii]|uniref:hypothetical protein n=2 Tax=Cronobacter sakazakii TaxID=28141 RepID=UPI0011B0DED3|nr:hypothetical protein [Cronobacter sakazakii]ELY2674686.1 hypothetical protein [Cronobacter sakazakii]ELY2792203.1 hypothetical protein [Cronobacter sakazakii]ELY4435310.1 hypothetical protein [Cronobacter sakazakii]KAB0890406.1 hypothetical protein FZI07_17910 [Cronobacter sakazakii]KAB0899549.1 hypothetical protein FZI05_21560 [Cronobacter sakazakii]